MPLFLYQAINENGGLIKGEFQAADRDAVIDWIKGSGHTPISADLARGARPARSFRRPRLPALKLRRTKIDATRFTRDLSILLKAGVPLERALDMLATLAENEASAQLIGAVRDKIRSGSSLALAMQDHPASFNAFYISMIHAGESGGNIDITLGRLAEFLDRNELLRNQVKTALIYPAILVGITLFSVIILVTFVVPQFASLFADMGQELPLPTRIVIGLGDAFSNYGLLVAALVLAAYTYGRQLLRQPDNRYRWHRWLLQTPLLGKLIIQVEVAVFARTLGSLLSSGVPLLSALDIVQGTLGNQALRQALTAVADDLAEGQGIAESMGRSRLFPPLATHLIQVGEESGQLDTSLEQLAEVYDKETAIAIQRLLALLEPLLIVGLGLIVGGIIMSILLAVLSVNDLAF